MSIYQMFLGSFFQFKNLISVRKSPFGKVIFYLVLLSFVYAIPLTIQVMNVFGNLHADGQKIAEKLPDFTIKDNQLSSPEENSGFIYQSNYLIFTFDPDNKRNATDIQSDLKGKLMSIGMLKDQLIILFPSDETTQSLLGDTSFHLTYDQSIFSSFNGKTIKSVLAEKRLPWFLYVIIFLVAIYPSFINLVFTILFTALFSSIWLKRMDRSLTFLETLKLVIVSATVPTLLSTLIMLFHYSFNSGTFLFLATSFIVYQAVRKTKSSLK